MDPITLGFVIGFMIWGASSETGRQLANSVLILGRDKLTRFWSRNWPSKNVLILGERESGKTALGWMLTEDKPYRTEDGQRVPPSPSLGLAITADPKGMLTSAVISRDSQIQGARVEFDTPGDPQAQSTTWVQMIDGVDPEGIIYMITGCNNVNKMAEQLDVLANNILTYYASDPRNLRVLFIFINFMDKWNDGVGAKAELEMRWRLALSKIVGMKFPGLGRVRIGVAGTQLNPEKNSWPEAKIAMTQFANMLGGR